MILLLDNYDSFTYNLVQYLGEMQPDIQVHRNDKLSVRDLLDLKPSHIIISPGPCTPAEAGNSVELVRQVPPSIPLLGVCLGHQSIGAAFGGNIIRAPEMMHGKTSTISLDDSPIFEGIPREITVTRYHSLIVERSSIPSELKITSQSSDGIVMAMEHKERPIYGVQFHPESILTENGKQLLRNFLNISKDGNMKGG